MFEQHATGQQQSLAVLWNIAISMRINILLSNGGINDRNWEKYQKFLQEFSDRCIEEPSFTEAMMFNTGKKGLSAEAFNLCTKAIAIMAFFPGGVEFMGVRYDASRLVG